MHYGTWSVLIIVVLSFFQNSEGAFRKTLRIAERCAFKEGQNHEEELSVEQSIEKLETVSFLVMQGRCFEKALNLALTTVFQRNLSVETTSLYLLQTLFEQRYGFIQVRNVAKNALRSADSHERYIGLVLLENLVIHGRAFKVAETAALVGICDENKDVVEKACDVFYALFDKKRSHEVARLKALELIDADDHSDSCADGLELLAALLMDGVGRNDAVVALNKTAALTHMRIKKAREFLEEIIQQNFLRRVYLPKKMTTVEVAALLVSQGLLPAEEEASFEGCSICCDEEYKSNRSFVVTDCDHIFCSKCFGKWFKQHNSCPLCRAKIFDDQVSGDDEDKEE